MIHDFVWLKCKNVDFYIFCTAIFEQWWLRPQITILYVYVNLHSLPFTPFPSSFIFFSYFLFFLCRAVIQYAFCICNTYGLRVCLRLWTDFQLHASPMENFRLSFTTYSNWCCSIIGNHELNFILFCSLQSTWRTIYVENDWNCFSY